MDDLNISKNTKTIQLVAVILFLLTGITVIQTKAERITKNRFIATDHIQWKCLAFKAESFLYDIDIRINIRPSDPDAQKTFCPLTVNDLQQDNLNNSKTINNKILRISVITSVNPLIGSKEDIKSTAFYYINNNTYIQNADSRICKGLLSVNGLKLLGYVKLSMGEKKRERIYWLKDTGVMRLKRMPSNQDEAEMSPDSWTDTKETFYSYGIRGIRAQDIIEPSILVLFPYTAFHNLKQASLLVLNKHQIYILQIHTAYVNDLHVFPSKKEEEPNTYRKEKAKYIKVSFSPRSLTNIGQKDKGFSFFGLRGDFDIYIDKDSGLPILIHGRLSGFGDVNIKLYRAVPAHE